MKIGILGGGQLGQMLADAARDLQIETLVLDPKPDAVAAQITRHLVADWTDEAAVEKDRLLDSFTVWGRAVCEEIIAQSPPPPPTGDADDGEGGGASTVFWADLIDPCTGSPVSGFH